MLHYNDFTQTPKTLRLIFTLSIHYTTAMLYNFHNNCTDETAQCVSPAHDDSEEKFE